MTTIISDWKQTLYNPEAKQLIDGAQELLDFLKQKNAQIVLIGKGSQDMYDEVARLQVETYFSEILFRDESKSTAQFAPFFTNDPASTYVIGDRIKGEITVGNELGATTIWVRQGKFANETPETHSEQPTYTVSSLAEAQGLLTTLL